VVCDFSPDDDFGRFLASVDERDVDLLLLEEFHVSDEFVAWFCTELGLSGVAPNGAWHSVSDTDGESDLLLRVFRDGRRLGVFIENKIGAPERDRQDERYHLRAKRVVEQRKLDEYMTVICAPRGYLDALSKDSTYQHRISYERIADWFGKQPGRRAAWRRSVMFEAIERARRGYVMVINAAITAFHQAYWNYLRRHPLIQMSEPKKRGNNSNWIILKGHEFPTDHNFDQRVVELEGRLARRHRGDTEGPNRVAANQRTANRHERRF
jgi:hypothetical protein